MELIERYIDALKKRLPEEKREGAENEVRNLIRERLDRLSTGQEPTEKEVEEVLQEMGDPLVLAQKYHPQKKYLIGPDFFDTYFLVLKIVAAAVFFGLSLALGISYIFNPPVSLWMGLGDYFSSIFSGVIQAAAWVTFFFALYERLGGEKPELGQAKKWSPSQLPAQKEEGKIRVSEPVLGIIFIFLAMIIFNAAGRVTGIFSFGEDTSIQVVPFLDHEVFAQFLPIINVFFVLAMIKEGLKFYTRKWTLPLAAYNGFLNISFLVLVFLILTRPGILDEGFLRFLTGNGDLDGETLDIIFKVVPRFFLVVFSVGLIIDTFASFFKAFKSREGV